MYVRVFSVILLVSMLFSLFIVAPRVDSANSKIYIAFVWHYHQPWYYSVDESYFVLPWVRMHSVGNYYKMAYILSKYPDVKATFTFSGSLLEMLVDYVYSGKMDLRQLISWRIVNGTVNETDVFSMLKIPGGFFDVNWNRVVNVIPRYSELRNLAQSAFSACSRITTTDEEMVDCVVKYFTGGNLLNQTVIDLAVLFNLFWIDPEIAREEYPEIYELMNRAKQSPQPGFNTSDLREVLLVHEDIMSKIIPLYRKLVSIGQVELIPVPYSHPLAPIIVDFGWMEDIEVHVEESLKLFKKYFNYTPIGVWPAEQAVNAFVVEAFRKAGIEWTITDESILGKTGVSTSDINNLGVPWYIDYSSGRIYIVFRHTEISNLISFQYSSWDHVSAVTDLVNRILALRNQATGPRLIVVALDGENPWENYGEFGDLFLNELYSRLSSLQKQGVIETITPHEFIQRFPDVAEQLPLKKYQYLDLAGKDIADIPANTYGEAYGDLPRRTVETYLPEGSWAGGELTVWIGDRQENVAWMWMVKARNDILSKLGLQSFRQLYVQYPDIARNLMRAEASDWWWWYGGDGGGSPETFDPIFKAYLRASYELAGLKPPDYLSVKAYPDGRPIGSINAELPKPITSHIVVDGVLEDAWINSVSRGEGLNIMVGATYMRNIYLLFDTEKIYIGFNVSSQVDTSKLSVAVYFTSPNTSLSPFKPGYNVYPMYTPHDLGVYLVREVLINPAKSITEVNYAAGNNLWINVAKGVFASTTSLNSTVIEASVSWESLGIPRGGYTYIVAVVYYDNRLVEWSSRLGLVHQLQVPLEAVAGKVVFEMSDPVGDDDGPGGYKYPSNTVFSPGVFDLTKFQVLDAGDKVVFTVTFRNLGGNPWNGPNGWSMQQVHIYIHTTLPGGKTETFGLNVMIHEQHAWHMALLIAPGWGTDPIPAGEKTGLCYYDKDKPIVQGGEFRVYADTGNNRIVAELPKSILYDVEDIDKWIYVVAVTSHDGYAPLKIRSFTIGGGEWSVNVPQEYAVAVLNNVIPYVFDVLAKTPDEQYAMLKSFKVETKELATLKGVGAYVEAPETPTTTPVSTSTTSMTTTPTTSGTTPTTTPATTPTTTTLVTTPTAPTTQFTETEITKTSPTSTPAPSSATLTEAPQPGYNYLLAGVVVALMIVLVFTAMRRKRSS
ncbi:MAG: glucodextranase DOMON-like domain-containing protein [Desulfurococcaceae archaeon]